MAQFAIGIDIGGTNTKFGIVNRVGQIIEQGSISTGIYAEVDDFVHALYENLQPIISGTGGIYNYAGIGIGAPNGNYYTGCIEYAANLQWKENVPLASMLEKKLGLKTYLTNDANAAAVGEMKYGAAKGMKHFIMITLGTGVGSGIIIDGKIVLGSDGFAGELGHNIIRPGGRLHKGTGIRGVLESYTSATGVRETAIEFLEKNKNTTSMMRNIENLSSKDVYECAVKGDEIAKQVFEFTGEILGMALANFIMFSSPEAIILFGGLAQSGDLIFNPTKRAMEENLVQCFKNKVKLLPSLLKESDVAILGASALVWDN